MLLFEAVGFERIGKAKRVDTIQRDCGPSSTCQRRYMSCINWANNEALSSHLQVFTKRGVIK